MKKIFEKPFEELNDLDTIFHSSGIFVTDTGTDEDGQPYVILASPESSNMFTFRKRVSGVFV